MVSLVVITLVKRFKDYTSHIIQMCGHEMKFRNLLVYKNTHISTRKLNSESHLKEFLFCLIGTAKT